MALFYAFLHFYITLKDFGKNTVTPWMHHFYLFHRYLPYESKIKEYAELVIQLQDSPLPH